MLLKDFRSYGIVSMTMCVYYFRLPVIVDEQFTSRANKNPIQHYTIRLRVDTTYLNQVTRRRDV
jgi:hypothetical protein